MDRLVQFYANKFPEFIRADMYQEGQLALLIGKDPYCRMLDEFRRLTHFRRVGSYQFEHYDIEDIMDNRKLFVSRDILYELRYIRRLLSCDYDVVLHIHNKEILPRLYKALDGLKPIWRLLINLYYWDGLGMKEIANLFGNTISAVSKLHKKILEHLRNELMQYWGYNGLDRR